MIQDVADKVWKNPLFHATSKRMELAWLVKDLGVAPTHRIEESDAAKLMQAAAVLACSTTDSHRRAAFRIATCAYELFGSASLPLDQALRVVLTRLGNFPSIGTRSDVDTAMSSLPLSLVSDEISIADNRTISVDGTSFFLTDFQHQLWTHLTACHRVALAAPTSAGKSFVLQKYLASRFTDRNAHTVVYIVPTRALIAQVYNDLSTQFLSETNERPNIETVPIDGDTPLNGRAIYVMTQERLQLTLSAHPHFVANTVIVDEAQSIAEGARGVLLQWVIDELLRRGPKTQMLFASPTIRNLDVFGRTFGLKDVVELPSNEPTVAQNFLLVSIDASAVGSISIQSVSDGTQLPTDVAKLVLNQTTASRIDRLVHIPAALGRDQSNIVYANGAAEAENVALQLADLFSDREPTKTQLALAELASEAVHRNYVLAECVKRGVAFHYSNIPTQVRQAIESAVSSGDINFLVCTSTLLQGVNLPVKNIFMCLPEKGRLKPLEPTDFWNLSGRAGRLRREFQGNIFLIDYANWKTKPLNAPKDAVIEPAMEGYVRGDVSALMNVIAGDAPRVKSDAPDLETIFVRLYSDLKIGELPSTFAKMGFNVGDPRTESLSTALANADQTITIPAQVIRRAPSISAHKQQALYERILSLIDGDRTNARSIIPKHPRESDAFNSYAQILELCHSIVLGLDTSKNLHRFHAVIAIKWMSGLSLPQIIDDQIKRHPNKRVRSTIRDTLDLIEGQIRFQAVRLFGCYNSLLAYALEASDMKELVSSIPSLPLYLEIGASDKTMISFITLGLSRVTSMKLNSLSARKDLDPQEAQDWLRSRPAETLGLSPILLAEVRAILSK